jgi:hypothetical protein
MDNEPSRLTGILHLVVLLICHLISLQDESRVSVRLIHPLGLVMPRP